MSNVKYHSNDFTNCFFFSYRTRLDSHDQPMDNAANVFLTQNDNSSDLRSNESASTVPKLPQITATTTS
jgi:hypothetical protein